MSYEGPAWDVLRAVGALIWGISWTDVLLATGFVCLVTLLWRLNRATGPDHPFSTDDIFLDDVTHKASLNKLVIAVMAGLAVWIVVTMAQHEQWALITELVPIILGVFVIGKSFDRWAGRDQMIRDADAVNAAPAPPVVADPPPAAPAAPSCPDKG